MFPFSSRFSSGPLFCLRCGSVADSPVTSSSYHPITGRNTANCPTLLRSPGSSLSKKGTQCLYDCALLKQQPLMSLIGLTIFIQVNASPRQSQAELGTSLRAGMTSPTSCFHSCLAVTWLYASDVLFAPCALPRKHVRASLNWERPLVPLSPVVRRTCRYQLLWTRKRGRLCSEGESVSPLQQFRFIWWSDSNRNGTFGHHIRCLFPSIGTSWEVASNRSNATVHCGRYSWFDPMRGTGWDIASENDRLDRCIGYSGNDVIGMSLTSSFLKLLFGGNSLHKI